MSADNINFGSPDSTQPPVSAAPASDVAPDTVPAPSLPPQSVVAQPEQPKTGFGKLFATFIDHTFGTAWALVGMTVGEVARLAESKLQLMRMAIVMMIVVPMTLFAAGTAISHWSYTLDGVDAGRTLSMIGAVSLWLQATLMVARIGIYASVLSGTTHLLGAHVRFGIDTSLPAVASAMRWLCGSLAWLTGACAYAMAFPVYRNLGELALVFTIAAALAFIGAAKWFESKVPQKVLMYSLLVVFAVITARFFSTNLAVAMDEFSGKTVGNDKAWIVSKHVERLERKIQAIQSEAFGNDDGLAISEEHSKIVEKYEARIAALKADPEAYFRSLSVLKVGKDGKKVIVKKAAPPAPKAAKTEAAPEPKAAEPKVSEGEVVVTEGATDEVADKYGWMDQLPESLKN